MSETPGDGESRFFRYLWRFNAFAIAVASVGFIVLGVVIAMMLFADGRSRRVTNVVNLNQTENISEVFSWGSTELIAGTSYVWGALQRGQSYGVGSLPGSKNTIQTVNYVFLNTSTGESRWLFESADQLIASTYVQYRRFKYEPNDSREVVSILYVVIDKDTNGDRRLTEKDVSSLMASSVDGTSSRKLIEGIEELYVVRQVADDKVLVLYLKNGQTVSEIFSVPALLPLSRANIPKVGLK